MYHRRIDGQFGQVANDGFGVAGGGLASAALKYLLAEQLGFGNDGQRGLLQQQSQIQRSDGNGQPVLAVDKLLPVLQLFGPDMVMAQQLQNVFSTTGGFRSE